MGDLTHALEAEKISVLFWYIFWNRIFPEDFFYFNKFLFELLKKKILSSRLQENEDLLVVFVSTIYSAKKKSKQWESVYSILHQVRNFSCFQACQNKWRFTVQNVDYIYKGYLVFIFESENLKQNASPRPRNSVMQLFWFYEYQKFLKRNSISSILRCYIDIMIRYYKVRCLSADTPMSKC